MKLWVQGSSPEEGQKKRKPGSNSQKSQLHDLIELDTPAEDAERVSQKQTRRFSHKGSCAVGKGTNFSSASIRNSNTLARVLTVTSPVPVLRLHLQIHPKTQSALPLRSRPPKKTSKKPAPSSDPRLALPFKSLLPDLLSRRTPAPAPNPLTYIISGLLLPPQNNKEYRRAYLKAEFGILTHSPKSRGKARHQQDGASKNILNV